MTIVPDHKPGLHPHLVRIRNVLVEHDQMATAGADPQALHAGLVDYDSLFIVTAERIGQVMLAVPSIAIMMTLPETLRGTWADGFLAGVRFAQSGVEEE